MTSTEIFEKLINEYFTWDATFSVISGRAHGVFGFSVLEDEETHDASWRTYLEVQETLESIGLKMVEMSSDNDAVWGYIEEKTDE